MRGGGLLRTAFLAAAISLLALQSGAARAGDEDSALDPRDDLRGMFVFKLPIGGGKIFSAPRVGLDIRMNRGDDFGRLKASRDPYTGRRLPDVDTGRVRTWSLEKPQFDLSQVPQSSG